MKKESLNEATLNIYKKLLHDSTIMIYKNNGKTSNDKVVYETFFVEEPHKGKYLMVIGHDLETGMINLLINDGTPVDAPAEVLQQFLFEVKTEYNKRETAKKKALEKSRTL